MPKEKDKRKDTPEVSEGAENKKDNEKSGNEEEIETKEQILKAR